MLSAPHRASALSAASRSRSAAFLTLNALRQRGGADFRTVSPILQIWWGKWESNRDDERS
jgi:hypothetical protein